MPTTLADIRERVKNVLKRKDPSTDIYDEWIRDAVRRIQRTLRTPLDEAVSPAALIPDGFNGRINVPGNLLNLISLQVDGHELEMRAISEVKDLQTRPAAPALYYAREGGQYLIAPIPHQGSKVTIHYRADTDNFTAPTDSIRLFDIASDLVMYGALIRGADWSIDDRRLNTWNGIYNTLFVELQDMADRDELLNASMAPAYNSNGDWT